MICYNLWLNRDYIDPQTGEKVEQDPIYLHLGYHSYNDAKKAKKKLEEVYEKDSVFISCDGPRISIFDGA